MHDHAKHQILMYAICIGLNFQSEFPPNFKSNFKVSSKARKGVVWLNEPNLRVTIMYLDTTVHRKLHKGFYDESVYHVPQAEVLSVFSLKCITCSKYGVLVLAVINEKV